jgi:hypothetical protein
LDRKSEEASHADPIQQGGDLIGCELSFKALNRDHAYRSNALVIIAGSVIYMGPERYLGLKLGLGDLPSGDPRNWRTIQAKPAIPSFAYLQSPNGSTAKSKARDTVDSETSARLVLFNWDAATVAVFSDILRGGPIKIGFNRQTNGMDLLTSIDLTVTETQTSGGDIKRRRSNEAVVQFANCARQVTAHPPGR